MRALALLTEESGRQKVLAWLFGRIDCSLKRRSATIVQSVIGQGGVRGCMNGAEHDPIGPSNSSHGLSLVALGSSFPSWSGGKR